MESKSRKLNVRLPRRTVLKGAAIGAGAVVANHIGLSPAFAVKGPMSTVDSYVVPTIANSVRATSILTVGDRAAGNGYRMVGIPDGLGMMANPDGTFTVLMNHEIPVENGVPLGITRAHGSPGAFVSKWTIARDLQVLAGEDLTPAPSYVLTWDVAGNRYVQGTTVWQRFCSADLPAPGAFQFGALGTADRLFMNGEEINEGRAWAHAVTGSYARNSWQLPRLGRMAWENAVASPSPRLKTIVMGMDDGALPPSGGAAPTAASNPSEVYCYVGTKTSSGTPVDRAGLTNGKLYGLRVKRGSTLVEVESNEFGLGDASSGFVATGTFELVEMGDKGDVSALSGLKLEEDSLSKKILRMMRPEDGAWDPSAPNDFYFLTTASVTLNSRLWRLRFTNMDAPEQGGTIEMLLRGNEGHKMFDNMTIDKTGRILIQEDAGNDPWTSKIWLYTIATKKFTLIAQHDPTLFLPGGSFITQDEESSGIIDASEILGPGWFLLAVQIHKVSTPELVEGGQLVALWVDPALR